MIDVEKNVDWLLATTDGHLLAFEDSCERRKSLLSVEKQFSTLEGGGPLIHTHLACRNVLLGLPDEDGAARIASIQRIEQIAHSWTTPDVPTLNLGKLQLAALNHSNERPDADVLLFHWLLVRRPLRAPRRTSAMRRMHRLGVRVGSHSQILTTFQPRALSVFVTCRSRWRLC